MMCRVGCHIPLTNDVRGMICRVDFHTQLADKANTFNSEEVKQLLQAVYDIMAPEGERYCRECLPAINLRAYSVLKHVAPHSCSSACEHCLLHSALPCISSGPLLLSLLQRP